MSTVPPEITEAQIKNALSIYGDIKQIQDEVWSQAYRLRVKNGVRLVDVGMKKHIPSHIKIEGHRALIVYEGKPMTCFRCNEQGHQQHECPRRRTSALSHSSDAKTTGSQNDPTYTGRQTMKDIIRAFTTFMIHKYEPTKVG